MVYLYVVSAMLRGGPSPSAATLYDSSLGQQQQQQRLRGGRGGGMRRSDVPALPDVSYPHLISRCVRDRGWLLC